MHYQYDKKYNPIGTYGCAFISCGVWAEEIADVMTNEELVNDVYAALVASGAMSSNCFIQDWAQVINQFLEYLGSKSRVKYIGWWNLGDEAYFEPGYSSEDMDAEILRVSTPWGYHFKTPGFNPYPELEQGDVVNGRRYFKVI